MLKKPGPETQLEKKPAERGGINPCMTEDPGFGAYKPWARDIDMGQILVPRTLRGKASASFDVMIHFHGHEAARKEWVQVMDGPVLVGIDLGLGSGPYEARFSAPEAFGDLLSSIERAMAKRFQTRSAKIRHLGLSAWSAGYGAIGKILTQPEGRRRVDSVILLDGLHSGYSKSGGTLDERQLAPFEAFAREAASRRKLMYVTHSSIIPPGYASTTETANFLIAAVGGRPHASRPRAGDPMGLDLLSWFVRGNFHVRGYSGNGKLDHCAQIGLYGEVLRIHVQRRWR